MLWRLGGNIGNARCCLLFLYLDRGLHDGSRNSSLGFRLLYLCLLRSFRYLLFLLFCYLLKLFILACANVLPYVLLRAHLCKFLCRLWFWLCLLRLGFLWLGRARLCEELSTYLPRSQRLAASVLDRNFALRDLVLHPIGSYTSLRERDVGAGRILLKRVSYCIVYRLKNRLLVRKFDLKLCGVDVYVDRRGIDVEEKHATRELLGRDIRGIRLLECRACRAALYVTSVDKEILIISVGSDVIRAAYKALDSYAVDLELGRDEL